MSDVKSYPTEESFDEPLMTVSEVIGIKTPEPVTPPEEEDQDPSDFTPYQRWVLSGSQDDLYSTVKDLRPTIDSVVASLGGSGNPQIAARARVIAAKAVQSYDASSGASLPTWVSQQLRQLTRDIRKSNSAVAIPDGVQLDGYAIYRAEKEFEDENGREPTVDELADKCHLSRKRIADVRKKMKTIVTGEMATGEDSEDGVLGADELGLSKTDYTNDALDYVYNESDRNDKKILEYTVGYGGADVLDNKQIMQKLKLTPVQLTRRKARLSMRINQIIEDLEQV